MVSHEWTRGIIDPAEIESINNTVNNSQFVLDIVVRMCYNSIKEANKVTRSSYTTGGWAFEQAHRNGEIAALEKLIQICTNKERT